MSNGFAPCPHCGAMIDYICVRTTTVIDEIITAEEGQHYEGDLMLDMASGGLDEVVWKCPKCKAIIEDVGDENGLDDDWAQQWLESGLPMGEFIAMMTDEEEEEE